MARPTEIWFEGELSPAVLAQAGGLAVERRGALTILSGRPTPAQLRRLVDALVGTGHRLVDVSGAPIERAGR